ncbi:MAG: hypothetical protein JSR73_19330 [Proteobacteria bacterium]|nr:hypothetical protein [Pseudomonadota bacterium]
MRRWAAIILVPVLLSVLPARADDAALAETLAAAKKAWGRAPPNRYEFMFRPVAILAFVGCAGKNIRVRVIDEVATTPAACRSEMVRFATIPRLFEYIRGAVASRPDMISVIFDPVLGYPTHFFVDPSLKTHDDEFEFTLSEFKVIE